MKNIKDQLDSRSLRVLAGVVAIIAGTILLAMKVQEGSLLAMAGIGLAASSWI